MITSLAARTGTVLQTSGSGISWNLIILLGIAAVAIIAVAWLLTSNSGGTSD